MKRWRTGTTITAALVALAAAPAWAADGSLDTTFSSDGKVTGDTTPVSGVAQQSTGKLVGAGLANGFLRVTRLTAAGAPDSTWGGDGIVEYPAAGAERVVAVETQADDKVVLILGGASGTGAGAVVRLTSAGIPDSTYDGDGRRDVTLPSTAYVRDGVLDSSGRAVILGEGSGYTIVLARLTTAGVPDTTFSGDGFAEDAYSPGNQPFAVAKAASGKLVVAGYHFYGQSAVSRYTAAGAPDTTFAGDGHQELTPATFMSDVVVDPSGRALAVLYSGGTVHLVRLTSAGAVDGTFGSGGTAQLPGWGNFGALAVQADGKPVIGGTDSNGAFRLVRTTTGGTPDATFAPGGTVLTPFDSYATLTDVLVSSDKKIVAAGNRGSGYAISRYLGGPSTDTTRPTVAITGATTTTGPVTFAFSEDVRGVSAANAVLRVTGTTTNLTGLLSCRDAGNAVTSCSTGLVRKATLTPRSPLVPGQAYTATANPSGATALIKDLAGNALLVTSKAFRGDLSVEESDAAVKQTWPARPASGSMGGSVRRESTTGASVTLTFTGTQATVYPSFGPDHGIAKVSLDNVQLSDFDGYSATPRYGQGIPVNATSAGTHTIKIEVAGRKNASSSGFVIGLDAFQVGSAAPQTDPAGKYLWRSGTLASASGGRFAATALGDGSVSVMFKGTSVSWRSYTASNQGTAKVYVDNVLKGTVDNYAASAAWVARSLTGLSNAVHTIRIVPTGQKSASSTAATISVDRFNVG